MATRRSSPGLLRHAMCAALGFSCGATLAQPSGLAVVHGGAMVQRTADTTTVTTTNGAGSRHSALDWRSFQVPGGKTVIFSQPDALSTSINRVTGKDPTTIAGTLLSNGRLVLVNPAGIAVGPGAVVDTAGFTASTLFMSRTDAIAGRLRFGFFSDASDDDDGKGKGRDGDGEGRARSGKLDVQGRVVARNGDVVLIGPEIGIGKDGIVEAQGGDVVLAAGQRVALTGRGLEGIRMEVRAPQDSAVNLGTLEGDSVAIFAGQLRHSGLVQARSATSAGGKVVLHASDDAELRGRVEAVSGDRGGTVHVTGGEVVLKSPAVIDVSHEHGGGEILLGGGSQGSDPRLSNASRVDVAEGVVLNADATLSGPGGTVIAWSDDRMDFRGAISARGAGGGAGGRVEVAAGKDLKFRGTIDVRSSAANAPPEPLAFVPREGQPVEVQAAMAAPEAESASFFASSTALLAPLSSEQEDPYERRTVVVDAVQCSVTR